MTWNNKIAQRLNLGAAMLAAADRFPEIIKELLRLIQTLKTSSALSLILRI